MQQLDGIAVLDLAVGRPLAVRRHEEAFGRIRVGVGVAMRRDIDDEKVFGPAAIGAEEFGDGFRERLEVDATPLRRHPEALLRERGANGVDFAIHAIEVRPFGVIEFGDADDEREGAVLAQLLRNLRLRHAIDTIEQERGTSTFRYARQQAIDFI